MDIVYDEQFRHNYKYLVQKQRHLLMDHTILQPIKVVDHHRKKKKKMRVLFLGIF